MKKNLIPYIGYWVRNCISMSRNPINKRSLIEEEVYDELLSTDIPDEIDYDTDTRILSLTKSSFKENQRDYCPFALIARYPHSLS